MHRAALLPVRGGDLLHGVHEVGVKGLAQRFDLLYMEGFQCLGGFVQRHDHALLVVLVGGRSVGRHIQRVENGDDLVHGKGNAVVELLVGFAGGALAVVVVLGSHAQQLILGLCSVLFRCIQLCLNGFHLPGLLVEPAAVLLLVLFGGSLGSSLFGRCGSGLFLGGSLRLLGLGHRVLCFFAHSRSSL